MSRYFFDFAYDGRNYLGWQIQEKGRTLQGEIEEKLSILLKEPVELVAAGRTDTGVHARAMTCHIEIPSEQEARLPEVTYRLNRFLPPDIRLLSYRKVPPEMHARFSAVEREYHYYITHCDSPFLRRYHTYISYPLDYNLMNEAAKHLIGTHDFTTFSKVNTQVLSHICTVQKAEWVPCEERTETWCFIFTANRFLRNMVRATVSTLIDVGRKKYTPTQFKDILQAQDRAKASGSAPADALFLDHVNYDGLDGSVLLYPEYQEREK